MNKHQYERYAIINTDTGEVVSKVLKKDSEELNITTVKKTTDKQKQAHHNNKIVQALKQIEADDMKKTNKNLGSFVNTYYVKNQLLLKETGLDFQDIARVLYLGTHLGYDTGNMLTIKHNQRCIKPMNRTDMMVLLGLKERALKTFISNAKKSGVLIEIKKEFFLSEEYFTKGEVKIKDNKGYTRIYVNPIRNLFNGVESRRHKSIGIIMSLIPFLNYDWNYLEKANGDYINLQEMNELLGYSEDNTSRLFKQLRGLKVQLGDKEHRIIAQMVLNEASDEREERIYINPIICYRGNNNTYHQGVVKNMIFGKGKKVDINIDLE